MKIVTRVAVIRLVLLIVFFAILEWVSLLAIGQTKEEWLRGWASSLADRKITPEMIAKAKPWQDNGAHCLPGSSGVIPLGDGGAVYVATHSAHENESRVGLIISIPAMLLTGRRPVADATIAVDQQGHIYTCEGHVCGYLTLQSKKPVQTLQDFLETCIGDDERNTWKPYHPE
jgi:hypothetical protein